MLNVLRKNLFIPFVDARRGNDVARYETAVAEELSAPRCEIEKYQARKFGEMVQHAYRSVPFYKRHYRQLSDRIKAIQDPAVLYEEMTDYLPPVTKNDITEAGEGMRSADFKIEDLRKSATGGTTRSPMSFYLERSSFSKRQAGTRYFMNWYGYRPGDKIAYLWGAEQDFQRRRSARDKLINYLTYRKKTLPSSLLNKQTMRFFYDELKAWRPRVLQAYPSALAVFAKFLSDSNLNLDIHSLLATAEPVLPEQRELIEAVFGKKLFAWYGARELGHAATECCCHEGLHLNTSGLLCEVLRDDGTIGTEGEGELLFTDLENRCFPFIRYRIGDQGVISKRTCPCGSELPFLESIIGRTADLFRRRDGSYVPGAFFAGRIVADVSEIEQLQIIQEDYEQFTLRVVKGKEFSNEALAGVKARLNDYLRTPLEIEVVYLDDIPREPSGKTRVCISKVTR